MKEWEDKIKYPEDREGCNHNNCDSEEEWLKYIVKQKEVKVKLLLYKPKKKKGFNHFT